jgi:hypothetical protein
MRDERMRAGSGRRSPGGSGTAAAAGRGRGVGSGMELIILSVEASKEKKVVLFQTSLRRPDFFLNVQAI